MKSARRIIITIGLATGAIFGLCIGLFFESFLYGALATAIISALAIFFFILNYCANS